MKDAEQRRNEFTVSKRERCGRAFLRLCRQKMSRTKCKKGHEDMPGLEVVAYDQM